MKFELTAEDFFKCVSLADRVSKKRSVATNNLVHSIHIEAKEDMIILKAMNSMGISITQPATVFKDGSVLLPGSVLHGFVSNISPEAVLSIEKKGSMLSISTSHNEAEIELFKEEEFPSFPEIENTTTFEVLKEVLLQGIENVSHIASPILSKPELATLHIYTKDDILHFVAGDRSRMAEKKMLNTKIEKDVYILLPIENVPDVYYLLKSVYKPVKVSFNEQYVSFESDGIYFFSRLIDGSFPKYLDLIPKSSVSEVKLIKNDLLSFFKKAPYFSDKFNRMKVEADSEKKTCVCTVENSGVGKTREIIPSDVIGESFSAKFDYQYIYDPLQSITSNHLKIIFYGLGKPAVIKDTNDDSFTYIVAPIID